MAETKATQTTTTACVVVKEFGVSEGDRVRVYHPADPKNNVVDPQVAETQWPEGSFAGRLQNGFLTYKVIHQAPEEVTRLELPAAARTSKEVLEMFVLEHLDIDLDVRKDLEVLVAEVEEALSSLPAPDAA